MIQKNKLMSAKRIMAKGYYKRHVQALAKDFRKWPHFFESLPRRYPEWRFI